MKTAISLNIVTSFALLLAGCTSRGPYRITYPNALTGATPAPDPKKGDTRVVEDHGKYKLAFIEFDQVGKLQEGDKQIKAAERVIRAARHLDLESGKKQSDTVGGLTILYIHGWKNNAQSIEGRKKDVEKFREALDRVATELDFDLRKMPVTGVYIGWRGKSINVENDILNFWTLFPRYLVAGLVSTEDLQKTVSRIINAGNAGRKDVPQEFRPRVILLGHSLGGRVLEGAVERAHGEGLFEEFHPASKNGLVLGTCVTLNQEDVPPTSGTGSAATATEETRGGPTAPVDLVLAVNEATRSFKVRRANKLCNPPADITKFVRHPGYDKAFCNVPANKNQAICKPYPLFVHIASKADWATRYLFLAALGGRTAPHSVELHTHSVKEIQAEDDPPAGTVFTFQTAGHEGDTTHHTYAVVNKKQEPNRHPIWVMRVERPVIHNHGDIWNSDFTNMLMNLMGGLQMVPMKRFSQEKLRMQ